MEADVGGVGARVDLGDVGRSRSVRDAAGAVEGRERLLVGRGALRLPDAVDVHAADAPVDVDEPLLVSVPLSRFSSPYCKPTLSIGRGALLSGPTPKAYFM